MATTIDPRSSSVQLALHLAAHSLLLHSSRRYGQAVSFNRTLPSAMAVTSVPSPTSVNETVRVLQVGVLGDGAQRQAFKLKKYLWEVDSDVRVKIGVKDDIRLAACAAGFTEEDGTLGGTEETIRGSDIIWVLLPVMTLEAPDYETFFSSMKPRGVLVVSDGSGLGRMQTVAVDNRKKIIAFHVNPEDMGPFVRDLEIRAGQIDGAGTDFNLPVHQVPAFPGWTTMQSFGLIMLAFGAGTLMTSAMDLAEDCHPWFAMFPPYLK